jgi:hypothetical protein
MGEGVVDGLNWSAPVSWNKSVGPPGRLGTPISLEPMSERSSLRALRVGTPPARRRVTFSGAGWRVEPDIGDGGGEGARHLVARIEEANRPVPTLNPFMRYECSSPRPSLSMRFITVTATATSVIRLGHEPSTLLAAPSPLDGSTFWNPNGYKWTGVFKVQVTRN